MSYFPDCMSGRLKYIWKFEFEGPVNATYSYVTIESFPFSEEDSIVKLLLPVVFVPLFAYSNT